MNSSTVRFPVRDLPENWSPALGTRRCPLRGAQPRSKGGGVSASRGRGLREHVSSAVAVISGVHAVHPPPLGGPVPAQLIRATPGIVYPRIRLVRPPIA